MQYAAHFIALGFGAGRVPKSPGTAGSLVGVVLFLGLRDVLVTDSGSWWPYGLFVALVAVVGTWAAHRSAQLLGRKDPNCIVIDEIAGMLLTLAYLPNGWLWLLVAFVLFRVFDILKPWPVGFADRRVAGGFGIMLDDLLAGGYALAGVQVLHYLSGQTW